MRSAALAAQVEMDVAICKISLPLSELGALKPGHLMKLPKDAVQQAVLKDRIGKTSLPVHLGQLNGMRAVRILKNPDMHLESQNLLNGVAKNAPILPDQPATKRTEIKPQTSEKDNVGDDGLDALLMGSKG